MFRRRFNPTTRTDLAALNLSRAEAAALTARYSVVDVAPGYHLCRQGRTGAELLFILDGTASVSRSGQTLATVGKGDVVGELSMLGVQVFQNADVVATTPVRAAVLNTREWRTVISDAPSLLERVRTIAAQRVQLMAAQPV